MNNKEGQEKEEIKEMLNHIQGFKLIAVNTEDFEIQCDAIFRNTNLGAVRGSLPICLYPYFQEFFNLPLLGKSL